MLDDFDLDIPEDDDDFYDDDGDGEGGGDSNRTFMMVAGGLGGVLVLALICMAVYVFFLAPDDGPSDADAQATLSAAETQNANIALTNEAAAFTPTFTITATPAPATATATASPTVEDTGPNSITQTIEAILTANSGGSSVTDTPGGPTQDPRTATVEALLTQSALAQTQVAIPTITPTATTVSSLPDAGFIDDYGGVGLVIMSALLLAVIFLARRMRTANS